jgi:Helicase conserved C-terminal domain/SNF2-related domain
MASLREINWPTVLETAEAKVVKELYEPALACAQRYDRSCAYFSSTVLSAASKGFGRLLERIKNGEISTDVLPVVRMMVNEELNKEDVQVLTEGKPSDAFIERLEARLLAPQDAMELERLECLALMVSKGWLEIRVGVKRNKLGILHTKFGLVYESPSRDGGDVLEFDGSSNETMMGLLHNEETLSINLSWEGGRDANRVNKFRNIFEALWEGRHESIETFSLPQALREKLIKFAPPEPEPLVQPNEEAELNLIQAKLATRLKYIKSAPFLESGSTVTDATAPVELWPHQLRVVQETSSAWPEGRLLCDEVGMGKTIEAILSIKRLISGRGLKRVLFLVPAGLCRQWQEELREKGGMIVPRLEAGMKVVWPDRPDDEIESTLVDALRLPFLVMSRETARQEETKEALLADEDGWDLVLFDESHAARRRGKEEGAFNQSNLLLGLMRDLRYKDKARSLMLLSATPMQISPWEPWDLISVLGEGVPWTSDFDNVRYYYGVVSGLEAGMPLQPEEARAVACQLSAAKIPNGMLMGGDLMPENQDEATEWLARKSYQDTPGLARWLRNCSPLSRRLHRNTRNTLRRYFEQGRIPVPPASRDIGDEVYEYSDPEERRLHEDLKRYIDARFEELEREKKGKGFVMTIYKRRLSSSPAAIKCSLERRLDRLVRFIKTGATPEFTLTYDQGDENYSDDPRDDGDLPESEAEAQAEIDALEPFLQRLLQLGLQDTKFDFFKTCLNEATSDGRRALVFTEYADTLHYLRTQLLPIYGQSLATYSGKGGQIFDGLQWRLVGKDEITRRLADGAIKLLLCTDAASEGLNLQAASALINYDLPWNPGKVEQRIGRIDRIGQKQTELRIRNIFLRDSVDFRVYTMLRERCRLFEDYVGAMQPVLERARNILEGGSGDHELIHAVANEFELGPDAGLISAAFEHDEDPPYEEPVSIVSRSNVYDWAKDLGRLKGATVELCDGAITVSLPDFGVISFGSTPSSLDRHPDSLPLSLPSVGRVDWTEQLDAYFASKIDRIPVVSVSVESGPFRRDAFRFIRSDGSEVEPRNYEHLCALLDDWDGIMPSDQAVQQQTKKLISECEMAVKVLSERSNTSSQGGLARMRQAALRRVLLQVGILLSILDGNSDDLNRSWYNQLRENSVAGVGLQLARAKDLFPEWPEWLQGHPGLMLEIRRVIDGLEPRRETSLRSGSALRAALEDPRLSIIV